MGNLYKANIESDNVKQDRAGFITFWLWLGIITNLITAPFTILHLNSMSNLGYLGMELITQGVDITPFSNSITMPIYVLIGTAVFSAICNIWGYAMLLKWAKKGFYIISFAAIINVVLNFICYPEIQNAYSSIGLLVDYSNIGYIGIVGACFSLFILWLILQIKKDGVRYWSQLK